MTDPSETQRTNIRAHTYVASAWVVATLATIAISLWTFADGRPLESGGFPWLLAAVALGFSAYLGTGLRAAFRMGESVEAQPLRRLSSAACGLVFVLAFPKTFGAMRASGNAGLYDLWREELPTPLGLGLSMVVMVAGGLLLWESVIALGEIRHTPRRARVFAIVLVAGFTLAMIGGVSEMVVGRSYLWGDS